MLRIGPRTELSETWRYALLGGIGVLPFTAASYWQTGSELSLNAVFWGALLAGYLVKRRGLASTPVGVRLGVVGGLPVLWMAADMLPFVLDPVGSAWFRLVRIAMVAAILLVGLGFSAFAGGLGGRLGGWLAERIGHPQAPAAA